MQVVMPTRCGVNAAMSICDLHAHHHSQKQPSICNPQEQASFPLATHRGMKDLIKSRSKLSQTSAMQDESLICAYIQEMEAAARSGEFPAITAVMASDGGERCPTAPAGNTTASPVPVPDPALDGPTFYRWSIISL